MLKRFFKDEAGVTAVEYGLIAALIAAAIIITTTQLGGSVNREFTKIDNAMP